VNAAQLSVPVRRLAVRRRRWARVALVLAGLVALVVYLRPGLATPGAYWPLWDVRVYWWGGQQAARGGALYAPGARYSLTYPPFAAALFTLAAPAPEGGLAAVITVVSIGALAVLAALSLGAAGVRRRPDTVFAVTALALLTCPVAYTLHLGEVNLILAALAGTDLLRRHDGYWWQGIGTGLAAGIKLTPLIFVAYLLVTRRARAAATAAGTFAATVAIGFALLPSPSRVFWLDGVGRAAAGGAGRHRVAAALRRVRPGRRRGRGRILRAYPAIRVRPPARPGPAARGRSLRDLRPGRAGGHVPRSPPGASSDGPPA
jgi:hypothetical protein